MQKINDIFYNSPDSPKQFVSYFKIVSKWKECLSKGIVANTTPVRLSADCELFVNVHDTIWLQELNYLKNELIEILNKNGLEVKGITYKYYPLSIKRPIIKSDRYILTDEILELVDDYSNDYINTVFYDSYKSALTEYFKNHTLKEFKRKQF